MRRGRLSLADRAAIGFGLMALTLALVLAGSSWFLVSSYVNRHQETVAVAQTSGDALILELKLRAGSRPTTQMVDSLGGSQDTAAVLVYRGQAYSSTAAKAIGLPPGMVARVDPAATAEPTRVRSVRQTVGGQHFLVVAAPLQGARSLLLELHPLLDLDRTLEALKTVLIVSVLGAGIIGLTGGRVASRRMLRPLTEVTAAAGSIAHGDLSARIRTDGGPDLAALAHSFNRTAAALERRVHADTRFAGDVSHELRTPLTTMINSIALIQNRRAELPGEMVEPIDLLTDELQRFRRLVVDLLEISRADAGRGDHREPVVVADLVRRATESAARNPVSLVASGAETLVVQGDKRRLERVVTNLVENADAHGGGCDTVRVERVNGCVRILVEDRGPGVDPAQRERVFDRFARDGSTLEPGVGLGLAIVAMHVHWHQGEVWVEGRPGGGARFVVELPVRP